MIKGITDKGSKEFSIFITGMHIFPYIHTKKRPAARAVGRFVFLMESPSLNPGCHFDNQLYLILGALQDDVDDSVDVGDVDFAIAVHVCRIGATISVQDDADDGIYICNIDLKVAVHVTNE